MQHKKKLRNQLKLILFTNIRRLWAELSLNVFSSSHSSCFNRIQSWSFHPAEISPLENLAQIFKTSFLFAVFLCPVDEGGPRIGHLRFAQTLEKLVIFSFSKIFLSMTWNLFEIVVRSRSFEEIRKNLKVKTQTTTHAFRKNISHSVQKKYSKLHYTSIRNLTQTNGKKH